MTYTEIYWYGYLASILLGLIGLTISTDGDCNITEPRCTLIAVPLFSLTSWLGVLVTVLSEIHIRYIIYKDTDV